MWPAAVYSILMCVLYRTGLSGCRKQNRHVSSILEVGIRPAWNLEWNFQRPTSPTPFPTARWSIQIICVTVNELDDMFPHWENRESSWREYHPLLWANNKCLDLPNDNGTCIWLACIVIHTSDSFGDLEWCPSRKKIAKCTFGGAR